MDPYKWNEAAYGQPRSAADEIRVKRVLPLVGKAGHVLDIGCLDGTIGSQLVDLGNSVVGIDASRSAVEKARNAGIDARIGNLEEPFPFPGSTFDLVFAGEIIEHIFDIDHLLAEIYRVLKPEGSLVLTTPNLAAFGRRLLLLVNRNPNIEISFTGSAAGHIRYFIKETLFEILARHSFMPLVFRSDVVNFNRRGSIRSCWLAKTCPTLGRSLIVRAKRCEPSHQTKPSETHWTRMHE